MMKLSTLLLFKVAKTEPKIVYIFKFSRGLFNNKIGNIMKIWLDFKRGNSHGLRGNSYRNAQRSVTQSVINCIPTQSMGTRT